MANAFERASTEVSAIVPKMWSQKYYDVLLAELPMESLISRDYEGEIASLGDTVKVPTVPEFSDATEYAEAAANDADAVTVTTQDLVINKHIVKDFIITNKASLQSIPFVEKLKELAIYSIQKKIQALILADTVPSAAAPDHTLSAVTPGTFALADILAMKELLDNQNIPMSDRHLCLGAGPLNDIFNITGFTSSDFVASGSPLQSGQLPAQLVGFMPHFSTVFGSTVYALHSSYMTIAAQQGMNVNEYDMGVEGIRAKRVNCDTLIGMKQLSNVRVVSCTV
jgi:hypothetical protein